MEAFTTFCLLLADALPSPADDVPDASAASVVWLWFAAKATGSGPVSRAFTTGWSQTEEYLQALLTELFPDRDAATEAGYLLAVLDGLAVARATEPARMPVDRAAAIVRRHIARHLVGE